MTVLLLPDGTLSGIDEHITRLRVLLHDLELLQRSGVPPQNLFEGAVDLEDWTLTTRPVSCLRGYPTGHPTVRSGHMTLTSELWVYAPRQAYARTANRFYRLGKQEDVLKDRDS
jgi:hypothetical protein